MTYIRNNVGYEERTLDLTSKSEAQKFTIPLVLDLLTFMPHQTVMRTHADILKVL